jgi:hypothetical protein
MRIVAALARRILRGRSGLPGANPGISLCESMFVLPGKD